MLTVRRASALMLATTIAAGAVVATATPAYALNHNVTSSAELITAIENANDDDVIILLNSIVLGAPLPDIDVNITIVGLGNAVGGGGFNGFNIVNSATVTIRDIIINDMTFNAVQAISTATRVTLDEVYSNSGFAFIDADITIIDGHFSDKPGNISGTGNTVQVTDSTFDDVDTFSGLYLAGTDMDITLTGVTADSNDSQGINANLDGESDLTVTDATITNNTDDDGLAVTANDSTTVTVAGSYVDNNWRGIALTLGDTATATITDTTVSSSVNDGIYSRMHDDGNSVTLTRVTSSGNGDDGAELNFDADGHVTITDSTIDENYAGIYFSYNPQEPPGSTALVERTTVSRSEGWGIIGTVATDGGIEIVNSTVSGLPGSQNALWVDGYQAVDGLPGLVSLRHSTITGHGEESGYPAAVWFEGVMDAEIDHSIISGNSATDDLGSFGDVDLVVQHSLIGTANGAAAPSVTGGTGNLFGISDPGLGALADNGGNTRTHLPDADSPAVGAGNAAIVGAPTTDQRGESRIVGVIDIGAVEARAGLADTGTDSTGAISAALLLLIAGAAALVVRRRFARA